MLCIKNGCVHTITKENGVILDILIENGKIVEIGKNLDCKAALVIDASSKFVYPGLIDAHSHLGMFCYGVRFEGTEYNELNDSLTPQLNAIDGFNPQDQAIRSACLGGVTCVGTGPGSSNVIGGKFIAVKTYGKKVDDMVIKKDVALKIAFGENPKFCYKDKGIYSRMTTASKLREILHKAFEYKRKKDYANEDITKMPSYDSKLEALIPVLEREIPLKAHAHRADDIFTALRIANEFNLKITLEHCTDGHLISEYLKDQFVAVGPSLTNASKFELKNRTFETPGILNKAGCCVSIITDAPVIPQEYLPLCAILAVKSGMDSFEALKAITINPAKHLGIEKRVGSLEVNKDADIIITDKPILDVNSVVEVVLVNGEIVK